MPHMMLLCNECRQPTGTTTMEYIRHYRESHPDMPAVPGIKRLTYTDEDVDCVAKLTDIDGEEITFTFMKDRSIAIVGENHVHIEHILPSEIEPDTAMGELLALAYLLAKPVVLPPDLHNVYWRTHGCAMNWPHSGACICGCGEAMMPTDSAYGTQAETAVPFKASV